MKFVIASDIHGSASSCEKLVEIFKNSGADKLILLGDILYHGPRNDLPERYSPKEVISLLSPLSDKILCIRGNCDSDVDQMVLPFCIKADYMPIFADGVSLLATHGHLEKYPCGFDCILQGHTHIPKCEVVDGVLNLNPGSISLPKEGNDKTYMIFENGEISLLTLDNQILLRRNLLG